MVAVVGGALFFVPASAVEGFAPRERINMKMNDRSAMEDCLCMAIISVERCHRRWRTVEIETQAEEIGDDDDVVEDDDDDVMLLLFSCFRARAGAALRTYLP